MTPQELKSSILQLAIQGKLVDQCPEEGTGEELYRQIQAEKQHLIKAGTIKKEKPLPKIEEDEIPFEIPNSWVWIRLGTIVKSISAGGDKPKIFSKSRTAECSVPVISNGETNKGIFGYTDKAEITERSLTVSGRGTIGYAEIRTEPYVPIVRLLVITPLGHTYLEYIKIAIQASTEYGVGSAVKQLTVPMLVPKLIPLPPIAEQKRIVAKIEKLLPLIDRYENAWSKLEDFNKRFPEDMQRSLLQMAIQGKLIAQRPEEGTAEELYQQIQEEKHRLIQAGKIKKEKPLPEITEEEKPFDIPESWEWVRLQNIFQLINGDRGKNYPSKDKLLSDGEIPFISAINMENGNVKSDGLLFVSQTQYDLLRSGKLQKNDFVFCLRGSLGKFCRYPFEKGAVASSLIILRKYGEILDKFIEVYLASPLINSQIHESDNGTAQPNLGARDIAKYCIPIPPLAEQKRIVAKLEQLLPLCERLKGNAP